MDLPLIEFQVQYCMKIQRHHKSVWLIVIKIALVRPVKNYGIVICNEIVFLLNKLITHNMERMPNNYLAKTC